MSQDRKLADVPLPELLAALHEATRSSVSGTLGIDREAARKAGLGRWSRVEGARPLPLGEAGAQDADAQWLPLGAGAKPR
ncbi:MAG: hypothetical protein H6733_17010 [Alphaproteobacteria bacterium]|nr:hypothetical protein [Alphaproteobacteria bacterium]